MVDRGEGEEERLDAPLPSNSAHGRRNGNGKRKKGAKRKKDSKARHKSLKNYFGRFFAQVNIEVTGGYQKSNHANYYISSEMGHYLRNYYR